MSVLRRMVVPRKRSLDRRPWKSVKDERMPAELTEGRMTMAYNPSELSVLSYANGFTMWHYRTSDTEATVRHPHYFNNAMDMLRSNDLLVINANDANFTTFVQAKTRECPPNL